MVSSRLFSERIVCQTHQTEYGSDHLAIVSEFMTEAPDVTLPPRRAYKNARWDVLNLDVKNQLSRIEKIDPITNLEEYIVLEGIEKSVPLAKPSPYNKRWWTEDLSQLRKRYTLFRNQARRQRRYYGSEFARPQYNSAQVAKRDYHSALRKQKKQHWDEFLDEPGNIWDTCRYIDDKSSQASFAPISGLKTSDTTKVTNNSEMAQVLLKEFFPPLPEYPLSTPLSPQSTIHQLPMVPITEDEITKAVFSASPLKGPGPDTIPALVWQILWPTVMDTVAARESTTYKVPVLYKCNDKRS